jgi:hypothetical protein
MQNKTNVSHMRAVCGPERYWVGLGRGGPQAVPRVSVDPPEMTHQDLGVVGVPDEHEQQKVLAYLRKHPKNGLEGLQRKHDKRIKRGEIVVRHNPFRTQD